MEGSKLEDRRLVSTGTFTPELGEGIIAAEETHTATIIVQSDLEVEGTWGEAMFGREQLSTMVIMRRSRRLLWVRPMCSNPLRSHRSSLGTRLSLSRWLNL